ncbi:MAG TPA: phenylacetate--CoA ligase family protein, partial [Solirubrobacteraceae bacterium]
MILDEIERAPRERLDHLQLARLRETVGRLLGAVPAGRDRLRAAGIESPGDIRSLDDLRRLPFTTK